MKVRHIFLRERNLDKEEKIRGNGGKKREKKIKKRTQDNGEKKREMEEVDK